MIKGIIFDLDDTLYDYRNANELAERYIKQYIAKQHRLPNEVVEGALQAGKNRTKQLLPEGAAQHSRILYFQHALEQMGINPIGKAWQLECIFWEKFLEKIEPYSGVQDVLAWLMSKRIKIAVCTDLTAGIQHQKIMKLGLDKYIDVLVTSEEVGYEKPDRRMFQLTLEKLQLNPKGTVVVGDSWEKDIQGAVNMGIKAIWKNNQGIGSVGNGIWKFANYHEKYFVDLLNEIERSEYL